MAVISRPGKEGNTTTYQGKVAAGYTNILAQEVDADFDAIYSAWNAGVDTVNIKDASVTAGKLAPGAVTATAIAPGSITNAALATGSVTSGTIADGTITGADIAAATITDSNIGNVAWTKLTTPYIGSVALTPRVILSADPGDVSLNANPSNSPAYDNTRPTWQSKLDYTGDALETWREAAGSSSPVRLSKLDGNGYLQLGQLDLSARAASAVPDAAYVSGGQNSTAQFNLQTFTLQQWAPTMRGYRVRIGGTIGVVTGSVELFLFVGAITVLHWLAAAPGWTQGYYVVDADILTNVAGNYFAWLGQLTQTAAVPSSPDVAAATTNLIRGNGTLPGQASIQLLGRFGTASPGNVMDKVTGILQAF